MIHGLVLLVLGVRFIYYYLKHKGRIRILKNEEDFLIIEVDLVIEVVF